MTGSPETDFNTWQQNHTDLYLLVPLNIIQAIYHRKTGVLNKINILNSQQEHIFLFLTFPFSLRAGPEMKVQRGDPPTLMS